MCLQKQNERPTAKDLLAHAFLKPSEAEDFMEVLVTLTDDAASVDEDDIGAAQSVEDERTVDVRPDGDI